MTTVMAEVAAGGLENVGTVITFMWSQVTSALSTITGNPILLIPVGAAVLITAVGVVRHMVRG